MIIASYFLPFLIHHPSFEWGFVLTSNLDSLDDHLPRKRGRHVVSLEKENGKGSLEIAIQHSLHFILMSFSQRSSEHESMGKY